MDFPAVLRLEGRTTKQGESGNRDMAVPKLRIRVATTAVLDAINNSNNVTTPVLTTVPRAVPRTF
jgi:hypothetical protein